MHGSGVVNEQRLAPPGHEVHDVDQTRVVEAVVGAVAPPQHGTILLEDIGKVVSRRDLGDSRFGTHRNRGLTRGVVPPGVNPPIGVEGEGEVVACRHLPDVGIEDFLRHRSHAAGISFKLKDFVRSVVGVGCYLQYGLVWVEVWVCGSGIYIPPHSGVVSRSQTKSYGPVYVGLV